MFDYNKILKVEKINLTVLDNVTLIDWELLDLGYDKFDERNFIVIEVWKDENNAIKILQQSDEESEEITNKLTLEQKEHIYNLVDRAMKVLQ